MKIKNKLAFTAFLSAAALSMFIMPNVYAAQGDIINAGFEERFTGWVDKEPSAISGNAYSGEKSAKIMDDGGSVEQTIEVKKNTNYELSAYIKGIGQIGVEMGDTSYSNIGGGKGKSFKKVVVSFNTGDATSVKIFARYYKNEARFDSFKLNNKDSFWF